ncbi:methionine-rich copper-binding protein CopC [Catenuloplanes nepalensis]|uniref:Methionine-rich copper-binding protein CopC n=1 Tax=Catenuloplanes nepalensis TaxID=587533 RepID=A0ABT9MR33_9ACTN|nr:copper resistance CopC family protein [Catenuloplanes nepalensis]MDP9793491.1 methionine-rich copper-binding protein CopC [Catenuloplanes nepalensis]
MIRRMLAAALAMTVAVLVPAAPAFAHNRLTSSVPAEGARLDAVPAEIVLEFAESLNPTYTQLIVTDAAKARVAVSDPAVDGGKATITFTGTPGDGVYTVAYRVVSKDGHPVQGSYAFTVGTGAPAVAASNPAAPVVADAPPAAGGSSPAGVIVLVALVVVAVAGGAVAFWLSRRRRPAV